MDKIKDGGPAFPLQLHGARYSGEHLPQDGMTLRDYFAAKAMQARLTGYDSMCSLSKHAEETGQAISKIVADQAYDMADAMLLARGE